MRHLLSRVLVAWAILAVAVVVTVGVLPGLEVDDWKAKEILAFAAVLAVLNLLVGPLLKLLSLPVMAMTLGLFGFVINGLMFLGADWWLDTIKITTLWAPFTAAILISVVRAGLTFLVDRRRD